MADHALIAHLKLSDAGFGTPAERQHLMSFEPRLDDALRQSGAGEFDGNEFGDGECVWYMYGADADALFAAIEAIVRETQPRPGSFVIKRKGPPGQSTEERIAL